MLHSLYGTPPYVNANSLNCGNIVLILTSPAFFAMSLKVACEPFIPSGSSQPYPDFSSFRDSTHKKDSSSPLSATLESPSVYVTFKVLHLVNAFRKRLTRKHTAQRTKRVSSKNIPDDFCRDFERQAFEEIDRYLGRKTSFPSNKRQTSYASKVPTVDWARATSNVATKGLSARQNIDRYVLFPTPAM